jgi:hypothetical protein
MINVKNEEKLHGLKCICPALQTADACGSSSYFYALVVAVEHNFNVTSATSESLQKKRTEISSSLRFLYLSFEFNTLIYSIFKAPDCTET